MSATSMIFFVVALMSAPMPAEGKGFLVEKGQRQHVNAALFASELQGAMGALLGCGEAVDKEQLAKIEAALKPMWRALPKNSAGRLERKTLRYLAHRYFMQTSSLLVRGFEPNRPVNHSHWGSADILSQQVPGFVEQQLESQHALHNGFSLQDAAMMVATLEHLIFDSESTLLDKAYRSVRRSPTGSLNHDNLGKVMESYLVHWMMGDDPEGIRILLSNRSLLDRTFPHWPALVSFAEGQIKSLDFARQRAAFAPRAHAVSPLGAKKSKTALSTQYTFDDAHAIVGGITKSFASFWDSECASMKTSLVEMDRYGTGRVPLSKFYGSALDSEWRFGESEAYLRELGALDETSRWKGTQVIIPNYMQAASNCIVSTSHYLVCCTNECEALQGEIEDAIGAPTATPSAILAVVSGMTSQTTIDDDAPPVLKGGLTRQLLEIGQQYSGAVPLHGRLFAQWLHYVFPRECPFPHKTGTASTATPTEFGNSYLAHGDEMRQHASSEVEEEAMEDGEWLSSQWSPDEEFIVDYSGKMHAPWEGSYRPFIIVAMLALLAVGVSAGVINLSGAGGGNKVASRDDIWTTKAHFV